MLHWLRQYIGHWEITEDIAMSTLTIADLETLYDHLADSLDRTPEGKRELMLVKLALLAAEALGDAECFAQLAEIALRDL